MAENKVNHRIQYYKRIRAEFDADCEEIKREADSKIAKAADVFADYVSSLAMSMTERDFKEFIEDDEIPFEQKVTMAGGYAIANDYDYIALQMHSFDDMDVVERMIALAGILLD